MNKARREHILAAANDLMGGFLYYDRKEDEDLPRGEIEEAIKEGEVSIDELVALFRKALETSAL